MPSKSEMSHGNGTKEFVASKQHIQAELYRLLTEAGFNVKAGVPIRADGRLCQVDLVLYNSRGAYLLIVVKKSTKPRKTFEDTMQYAKYTCIGVPIKVVRGISSLHQVIQELKQEYNEVKDI
jgi:hypothetical protein